MDCNSCENIDLHIHSTASDGTKRPFEIVKMAVEMGLGAISITDHDTVSGAREALAAGIPASLFFLPGVEISADPPAMLGNHGSLHILGYNIDLENVPLGRALRAMQAKRRIRNPQIIEKLHALGFEIEMQDVRPEAAGDDQIGRPHIAKAMQKRGIVASIDEAFDTYLAMGQCAYVARRRMACKEVIAMIRAADGIAVLAHPGLLQLHYPVRFKRLIKELKSEGLGGLEAYHSEHTPEQTDYYIEIAREFSLLVTGGSDYHGDLKPEIKMGVGRNNLKIPLALYEGLVDAVRR